jgi:hypothetical protein
MDSLFEQARDICLESATVGSGLVREIGLNLSYHMLRFVVDMRYLTHYKIHDDPLDPPQKAETLL